MNHYSIKGNERRNVNGQKLVKWINQSSNQSSNQTGSWHGSGLSDSTKQNQKRNGFAQKWGIHTQNCKLKGANDKPLDFEECWIIAHSWRNPKRSTKSLNWHHKTLIHQGFIRWISWRGCGFAGGTSSEFLEIAMSQNEGPQPNMAQNVPDTPFIASYQTIHDSPYFGYKFEHSSDRPGSFS
jgi:hypothetical protein